MACRIVLWVDDWLAWMEAFPTVEAAELAHALLREVLLELIALHRALRSVVGREGARNASESADQEARKELTDA